jgi:radical SAM superfamily enzyme YgiQ (UPF0313 family)
MSKFTIYLADLRHNYLGYVSSDAMPLGIGYMKAVMDSRFNDSDIQLFAYPTKLEKAIKENAPDILMLTNYTWNETVSLHFARHLRKIKPEALIVMGGPNIPIENERRIDFMKKHPYLDIYAIGEGDFYAADLAELFLNNGLNKEKLFTNDIHSSVYKKNGNYIVTDILPRTKNLDEIPSPWLTGVMDPFFDGMLVPLFETNRGCPFSCSFCVQGTKWYSKVHHFSLERIREEIEYIARKISTDFPQQKMLRIADPNFGMFNRDVDIASYLGETQRKYNYPLLIDATTGKNRADNIIKTMEKVNGALIFYQAVQSLDDEVLENIQRSNIKLDSYKDLQVYIKGRGLKSSSDLILGLPGESLNKHLLSLEKLINSGTDKLNNFQAMLLKGSEMETVATREKFGFTTKFRMLPKAYGIYFEEAVFDNEEIIVSTRDLHFEEYLKARKFHLAINIFWNFTRFETLIKIVQQFGYTPWQWLENIVESLSDEASPAAKLMNNFIAETKGELFDSEEQLIAYFSRKESFDKLNSGETGDNLIYKYRTLGLFYFWEEINATALQTTLDMIESKHRDDLLPEALKEYSTYTQYLFAYGKSKEEILQPHFHPFRFNIKKWIFDGGKTENLSDYVLRDSLTLKFELSEENRKNLNDAFKIWSFDPKSFSMFIRRIHNDWLKKSVSEMSKVLVDN